MRLRVGKLTVMILSIFALLGLVGGCQPMQASGSHSPQPRLAAAFPSWLRSAAASGVAGLGVQGWGPGASGIAVQYLYRPYADALASELLDAMRRGNVIPATNYALAGNVSQGGAAYLVLTFSDGTSIDLDKAVHTPPSATSSLPSVHDVSGPVYYINSTSISAAGTESDSSKQVFCLVDTSGSIDSIRSKVFSAMTKIEPTGLYPPVNPSADWLRHLPMHPAPAYAVEGNDGTHLFRHILSTQTTHTDLNGLLTALANATVVPPATVRSTSYGFRAWGRTHSRSLSVSLRNGETVNISTGYIVVKRNQPVRTAAKLFRVTSTDIHGSSSVFVEDSSGVIGHAWAFVNQLAPMPSNVS